MALGLGKKGRGSGQGALSACQGLAGRGAVQGSWSCNCWKNWRVDSAAATGRPCCHRWGRAQVSLLGRGSRQEEASSSFRLWPCRQPLTLLLAQPPKGQGGKQMRLVESQLLHHKTEYTRVGLELRNRILILKKNYTHTHKGQAKLSPASILFQHGQMTQESNIKPRTPVIVRHTNAVGTTLVKLTMPSLHEL